MENSEELSDEAFWKKKIREHRNAFIVLIIAAVCFFTGVLLVFFWVIEENPFVNPRIGTFDSWKLDYIVGMIILIILWELLFVGVPTGLFFGVGGYLWWRSLPEEEKQEFKDREKKEKARRKEKYGGGGGGGLIIFIGYCLYHYIIRPQTYYTTFGSEPFTYWIYSWFLTLMWIFIVLGIPAVIIALIWYLTKGRKK